MPRRGLLPAFSTPYIKGLVLRFWSKGEEMTEKKAEVVRASEWWRGGGGVDMGKWSTLATLEIIGSPGFSYGFRAREGASISGSSYAEEKCGLGLADSYNTIIDMGVHRTEWKIQHRTATRANSTPPSSLLFSC